MEKMQSLFSELVEIMQRLRSPGGCPWDREQTQNSLKPFLIEETYEVIEAIEEKNPEKLKEELGDLLYQILFHAQISAEKSDFGIQEVLEHSIAKMKRRHPHVYGNLELKDTAAVLANWEDIKRKEKTHPRTIFDGIPVHLPALVRAHRVQERVSRVGKEEYNLPSTWKKLEGKIKKLQKLLSPNETVSSPKNPAANRPAVIEEKTKSTIPLEEKEYYLGEILFLLVYLARLLKIDPEEALRQATCRFTAEFQKEEHPPGNKD